MTDNELIAEFMGGSLEKRDFITIGGKRTGKWTFPDRTWCYDDQLQYSKRWDWLMPVVYKIDSLDLPNIEISIGKFKTTLTTQGSTVLSYYNKQHGGKIGATYKAVVEFIKWYNENKPL